MHKKNISGIDLSDSINSEDILGKDVIDLDGLSIGVVERVLIDPNSIDFIGISIDKGFLKRGLTIGKNYIDRITVHAVFLNIRVAYELKGKIVFDKDGRKIGLVSSIDLYGERNKLKSIHIKTGAVPFLMKKEFVIEADKIKNVGENIILKVSKDSLSEIRDSGEVK